MYDYQTNTISAITFAVTANGISSATSTFCYLCTLATPTISPAGGTFTSAQQVTIADATPGVTIYYTLDGSTPTANSTAYSTRFTLSASATVKAIAILDGTSSPVGSATFTISSAAPNFKIVSNPPIETVKRGNVGAFLLQLNAINGFNAKVTLTCSGGPAGSYSTDFPMSVTVKSTQYAVSGILFPKNSTPGTYTITFKGVSGSLTNTATSTFILK